MQPIPLRPDVNASRAAAVSSLVRAAIATGLRHIGTNYAGPAKAWPNDRDADLLLRAPSAPLTTTNTAALSQIAYAFVSALVPVSASAALISRSLQLSFNGAASISVPSLTLPLADFVGQGKAIPAARGTSEASTKLEPHKLAVIVALTGEMMRGSNSEALVRQVLLDNTGPSLDAAMFSTTAAVPDLRPPGLLNGIAPLTPSTGTTLAEAMINDIGLIASAVAPIAGNGGIVLVASPPQAVALTMRTARDFYPVLMSAALSPGTVIAIAARALATAIGAPQIDASRSSTMHMADPASDVADIGGTLATPVLSMMQVDAVALRLRMPVAWALRSPTAMSWMDNVTW